LTESKNPMGKIYIAEIYKKKKMHREALKLYEDVVTTYPSFSQARINLAFLYSQLGNEEKAIYHFELLANSSHSPGYQGILKKLVNYYAEKKQMDKVELYLNKIYSADPEDLNVALSFGKLLVQNEKLEEAAIVFEDLKKKVVDSDAVNFFLG